MGDLFYIILGLLGILATGIGVGGYARGRKKRGKNSASLPPEKPPADVVAPPVPKIAPTPSEVAKLDDRARKTDNAVAEVVDLETEIDETPPPTDKPDPGVVDFLKRQGGAE